MTLDPRELKRRADFVAIASRYTKLRRAGSQWRGLCPIHTERTPSFYVEPEQKIWKCFGCDRGGDLFDFVIQVEGCDFPRALRIIAGIVSGGERRSRERLAANERGEAPSARAAGVTASRKESEHARLVARLDATEKRNAGIARTNADALASLATACEPGGEAAPLLVNKRITGRG